jgi:HEAT repeat protein
MRTVLCLGAFSLLLLSTGCQQIQNVTNYFRGNTPGKAARMMEDATYPDSRRAGIAALAKQDFAHREPYTTRYRQIFQTDEDPLVRAQAIRALNVSRDIEAGDLFLKALSDPDPLVRLEGAKALNNIPNEAATDALLRLLNSPEENQDVRIAAAAALRYYARRDVARALVGALDERSFGIAWQARRSLKRITGVDYAYDDAAWLEYISNPTQPLG